jgi:hypothetical protein
MDELLAAATLSRSPRPLSVREYAKRAVNRREIRDGRVRTAQSR